MAEALAEEGEILEPGSRKADADFLLPRPV